MFAEDGPRGRGSRQRSSVGKQGALKVHQHRTDGPAGYHNGPDVSFGRAVAGSGQKVIFKR